jgi:hypothetical protein
LLRGPEDLDDLLDLEDVSLVVQVTDADFRWSRKKFGLPSGAEDRPDPRQSALRRDRAPVSGAIGLRPKRLEVDGPVVTDRTIDSHIKKLRKKIAAISPDEELIRSVYGVGYTFEKNEPDSSLHQRIS